MEKLIVIPIIISLLFIFISLIILPTNLSFGKKIFSLLLMFGSAFFVWNTISSYTGYATIEQLPDAFVLVWSEEHKSQDYIEILMEPYTPEKPSLFGYKHEFIEKRLYRIKYDEKLAERLEEGNEKTKRGVKVVFKKQGGGGQNGSNRNRNGNGGEFVLCDGLPHGRMPVKD